MLYSVTQPGLGLQIRLRGPHLNDEAETTSNVIKGPLAHRCIGTTLSLLQIFQPVTFTANNV